MHVVIWLVTGAVVGWLVGLIMRGRGYGLIGDTMLGLLGGVSGGWIFHQVGLLETRAGWAGHVLMAVIGGVILVALYRLVRRVL